MPVSPARAAAFDILFRVESESSYGSELLHSTTYKKLSVPDHSLTTELVMGVLRWRSQLDDDIAAASSQKLAKLDLAVLIALRLALYQFRFLDRIPQRAALHESVELVKRARKRSAAPFVNAVLRKLSTAPRNGIPSDDETPMALVRTFAHPRWLVERWAHAYGLSAARQICEHNQSVPTTSVRLRDPKAAIQLNREGISLKPGSLLATSRSVITGDVTKTEAYRAGQIVIQDEASQLVATLGSAAALKEGSRILDCCASPGGKTLAMADRNPGASITAIELHPHRARLLQKLLRKSPTAAKIQILVADAQRLPTSTLFDRVLVDAPCSGTGTLSRNPEIKWRLTAADLTELHNRQDAILRAAMAKVAQGGRLTYSTCSLEKEENEDVVQQALAQDNSFRLLDSRVELENLKTTGQLTWQDLGTLTRGPYLRTIPGIHPCDGFFAAILERI